MNPPTTQNKAPVYVHPNHFVKPNATGEHGETLTEELLKRITGENRILRNVYIPKLDGKTAELDIVLINDTGIYVIESKNIGGWVFGNDKHERWTISYPGGKKYSIANPIWQNNGHINALKQYLGDIQGAQYYSYIVFSERCELKRLENNARNTTVLQRFDLLDTLCRDMNQRPATLSLDQVNAVYEHLRNHANASDQVKVQHIWDIKNRPTTS